MIDIHHHLLWEQDDGATNLDLSLDMARMAAADGITHIACTPHANGQYVYDPEIIAKKIARLQHLLDKERIDIKLGRGCDFHMSYDNIEQARNWPHRFTLNGGAYLLVEIPDFAIPRGLGETFYRMQLDGLTPILTHPERNATLQQDHSLMMEWMRAGVLIQITCGSVTGRMGKIAQRLAHLFLSKHWVHFLATDAHNVTSRPPKMHEAHDLVAEKYGPEYARLLCISNPLAAFMNKPMPPQLEPIDLYQNLEPRSWWRRLLNR